MASSEDRLEEASRALGGADDLEGGDIADLRRLLERSARLLDGLLHESRGLQGPRLSMQLGEASAFVQRSLLALRERDVAQPRVAPSAPSVHIRSLESYRQENAVGDEETGRGPKLKCRGCGKLICLSRAVRDLTEAPRLTCPECGAAMLGEQAPGGLVPSLARANSLKASPSPRRGMR